MEQKKCEARIDNYTAPTSGKIGDFFFFFAIDRIATHALQISN
jgi:hypothetical protein